MGIISDADANDDNAAASSPCSPPQPGSNPRLILSTRLVPERQTYHNRALASAINASFAAASGCPRRSGHGGWPGLGVLGRLLSWIFSAGAARAARWKKPAALLDRDAREPAPSKPAAPVSGRLDAGDGRRMYALSANRFTWVNMGHKHNMAPAPRDDDMTEHQLRQARDLGRWQRARRPCILPEALREELEGMVVGRSAVSAGLLRSVADRVERWYHGEGFACAQVVGFGSPSDGELACGVLEGDITRVEYQFVDKLGNVVDGKTCIPVIDRELPQQLRPGNIYNTGARKQALKDINSLGLFSNVELNPRPDETKEGGLVVQIKLREAEPRSADVTTQWSIAPAAGSQAGKPTLASLKPGGSVSFEDRNISGLNRSLVGSVTSRDLLNPKDDLSFKFEYEHPYLDGVANRSRNRTFKTSFFNTRKLSPIFVAGPSMDKAPPIWIDRVGFKANITESFTKQSKFTYGLVLEEITARDEKNNIRTHGSRLLPNGALSMDGPPTTFSGTGVDRMAFLQCNMTRDTTEFVNGATIGDKCIFQVDQGLGIGSKSPFFNRHQLSVTKFINLNNQEKGSGKPAPAVLTLHGRYAGCVGDLPSYDAFALGGPHSVRGYDIGELGAARNLLEVATELRVPVTVMNRQAQMYAFAEYGNDLGSSKDVDGNPTQFFQHAGSGSSYGVGVKLGNVRAEFAVDHNAGTGSFSFRFGERF